MVLHSYSYFTLSHLVFLVSFFGEQLKKFFSQVKLYWNSFLNFSTCTDFFLTTFKKKTLTFSYSLTIKYSVFDHKILKYSFVS